MVVGRHAPAMMPVLCMQSIEPLPKRLGRQALKRYGGHELVEDAVNRHGPPVTIGWSARRMYA